MEFYSILRSILRQFLHGKWVRFWKMVEGWSNHANFFTRTLWRYQTQYQVLKYGPNNVSYMHDEWHLSFPSSTGISLISISLLLVLTPPFPPLTSYNHRKARKRMNKLFALLQWDLPEDTSLLPWTRIDLIETAMKTWPWNYKA